MIRQRTLTAIATAALLALPLAACGPTDTDPDPDATQELPDPDPDTPMDVDPLSRDDGQSSDEAMADEAETGDLDVMLMKIADNYDEEVDVAVASLLSLLEPFMVVILGGIVGAIVLALFLPLVKMIESVSQSK